MKKFAIVLGLFAWVTIAQAQDELKYPGLEELDDVLRNKELYVTEKQHTIQRLKRRLSETPSKDLETRFSLNEQLYQQYSSFIYDSAFAYSFQTVRLGYALNDPKRIAYAKTLMSFTTLSAGMFKETFDTLNTIRISDLSDSVKVDYYALMARALYDLSDFNRDDYYSERYVDMADKFIEFATNLSDPNSYNFLYLNGLQQLRIQKTDESVRYLTKLLNGNIQLTNHQYAITASTLSFLHLKLGDTATAVQLLSKAAISDIKAATKEASAMTSLAELLYRKGFTEQAYRYLEISMSDANFYGAKQRMSEVGTILPIIAAARLNQIDGQRKTLLRFSLVLTLLSILTIAFALITLVQFRRIRKKDRLITQVNNHLQEANVKLQEANHIKEEYLGYYFNINSEYIDKIEKFKRQIDQRLIDKKYEEIRYVMSRIDLKKEREELYQSFDRVFLKLFPNFVTVFNSYFAAEDQIVLEKDQLLNTELRIFALIRMGVTDSDKLANILGYSVNTIYAYKNRIKSKSILANEEFEKRIMEIEAI